MYAARQQLQYPSEQDQENPSIVSKKENKKKKENSSINYKIRVPPGPNTQNVTMKSPKDTHAHEENGFRLYLQKK